MVWPPCGHSPTLTSLKVKLEIRGGADLMVSSPPSSEDVVGSYTKYNQLKAKKFSCVLPETDNKRFYLFQVSFLLSHKAANNENG